MDLQFFGAAEEVTGSCYLLNLDKQKVLIECGLLQGSYADEKRNHEAFPFSVNEIDAVILTHAHLDHSGRLPLLVKRGYRGPIFTHRATKDLLRIMLLDAAFLAQHDPEPLYDETDVENCLQLVVGIEYQHVTDVIPGVKIRLQDAGHIIGSSIVECMINVTGVSKKIVFSGDLGHSNAPLLRDPVKVEDANLVLMESTYGNRNHRPWEHTWDELKQALDSARKSKGNILIPAFAVGRTQELLYTFHKHYNDWDMKHWRIFLDSPMAIQATKIYSKHADLLDKETQKIISDEGSPFRLPNLRLSKTTDDSMNLNNISGGAIIIAGSGMCNGGRIKHHLKHNVWNQNCHIFIVGYQAYGTLGRQLVSGAKSIDLYGDNVQVNAQIHTIGGLSAHADQDGLLDWYSGFSTAPELALVHGEGDSIRVLADKIYDRFTVRAMIPDYKFKHEL